MKIIFTESPWWLLLLIPAVILTLIPYFKLAKRYRRTRNRIGSIVLHLTIMVLSILTLAGFQIHYEIPNDENEIIVLVDVSDTEEQSKVKRDRFVELVLEDSRYDNYKVGVVTFGFDQIYAVPLTYDVDGIYQSYLNAELPDTTATNLADALEYTRGLFSNPQTAKIVLVTDGKETDKNAGTTAIRAVASQGTKLDVAYVPSSFTGNDVQVVGIELPNYHVNVNEECAINVLMESNVSTTVNVRLQDVGEGNTVEETQSFEIVTGAQTISFDHIFTWEGLHELRFDVTVTGGDSLQANNIYSTYLNLEVYNNILILESVEGASQALTSSMNDGLLVPYDFTVKHILDEDIPKTVEELRLYDQILLNNISNEDLTLIGEDFSEKLEEYVNVHGGGLFTVGGHNKDGKAHAYNRKDMAGTLYQQMLPVQAINYTPPVGVMIVIDRSGSMNSTDAYGDVMLEAAKAGAAGCLQALSERDYVGVMTLDNFQASILPMTPRTQESKIRAAINSITPLDDGAGTVFTDAIFRAGTALRSLGNVDKRHIILVTDGEPGDEQESYESYVDSFYKTDGITLSVVLIGQTEGSSAYKAMESAVEKGHGRLYATNRTAELISKMKEDLNAPEITEVVVEEGGFHPIIGDATSPLVQGLDRGQGVQNINKLSVTLDGFFGVKARSSANVVLMGDYEVPIYAQWAYGEGMVGSFMCDLNNVWSQDFMADENGRQFIRNAVNNLMPTESIRPKLMGFNLTEDNYTNQLSVFTTLEEGQYVKGEIIRTVNGVSVVTSLNEETQGNSEELRGMDCYVKSALKASNNYSRCEFIIKDTGTYRIVLTKYDANGNVVKENGEDVVVEIYKSFAHSEEYDATVDTMAVRENLSYLAERADGAVIKDLEDPVEVFEGFVTSLPHVIDPRFTFMIIAIVLFLMDIAIRKFKFKWPHEIIRDFKEKRKNK
ncbi:MAG: VWA domain-containing protein [Clostridia bacterium]|nr:VWA domain-containing protein [Clostridia bacterium]